MSNNGNDGPWCYILSWGASNSYKSTDSEQRRHCVDRLNEAKDLCRRTSMWYSFRSIIRWMDWSSISSSRKYISRSKHLPISTSTSVVWRSGNIVELKQSSKKKRTYQNQLNQWKLHQVIQLCQQKLHSRMNGSVRALKETIEKMNTIHGILLHTNSYIGDQESFLDGNEPYK